ncbi:amidase [Alkalibacillus aidingensis]|uniref:amidase n=1 Tax=Alkalibacillus aidingensis TaxID=2747607 RepID=UPI001660C089|nr:amidase [Alkalibacillus aidingensis]
MRYLDELQKLDALGQKELIDRGEVTAEEVTAYYIDQINQLNPKINAVVHTMFEEAYENVENYSRKNHPLCGLPFLIKDLNPVAGHPFTNGSRLQQHVIAEQDDVLVSRYRDVGLNFLGKTNTPEFGFLPTTEPELFGATRNPWDLTRSPGGSSGGAAAAVASGMIPFAHASDGGGSIRIPASCCGLFGFKPSRGQLPISPYVNQISINHAITRSVRDSAILLDAVRGGLSTELYPTFRSSSSFLEVVNSSNQGKLRIAATSDWNGQAQIDQETRQAFDETVNLLQRLGHDVDVHSPNINFELFAEQFIKVWVASGSVVIKHLGAMAGVQPSEQNLEPLSHQVYRQGSGMTALEYEEARVILQIESQKFLSLFEQYDVLLTPVINKLPVKIGEHKQSQPDALMKNFVDYCSFTPIANVTGQPAMSVPVYWTESGVPIGMQLSANVGDDARLFKLATQIEQAKPWFDRYQQIQF